MIETRFIKVKGVEINSLVELPLEDDNTLSLEVLLSQFPYATGLKAVNKSKDKIRTIRKVNGKFFLSQYLKQNEFLFHIICPQSKKKLILEAEVTGIKQKTRETIKSIHYRFPYTFDMIVLGLSYDTTEVELSSYLNRFGELLYCKLSLDDITNESRGKAFFRFKDIKSQNACLSATHMLDKTKIVIKVPTEKVFFKENKEFTLYADNIPSTMTREDIRMYFSQYGLIINIHRPVERRKFAFIAFSDQSGFDRAISSGQYHTFNGSRINIKGFAPTPFGYFPKVNKDTSDRGLKRNTEPDDIVKTIPEKQAKQTFPLDVKKHLRTNSETERKVEKTNKIVFNLPPTLVKVSQPMSGLYQYPPNYGNHTSQGPSVPSASTPSTNPATNIHSTTLTTVPPSSDIVNSQCALTNEPYSKASIQTTLKSIEEQNQLQNLVNEFIQEIKVNLNKFTNQ